MQAGLRDARKAALDELRREAASVGADAVVGVEPGLFRDLGRREVDAVPGRQRHRREAAAGGLTAMARACEKPPLERAARAAGGHRLQWSRMWHSALAARNS